MNHRAMAYALFRISIGNIFLFYGIEKLFSGASHFARGLEKNFAQTWLPQQLVHVFAITLPFFEVTFGTLLIFGLLTRLTLVGSALLMIALTMGTLLLGDSNGVALNMIYSLAIFLLLFYADDNLYSIDRMKPG
jgi:thiosulfate dehydrogenase [quinone] large subunit